MSEPFIGEIRMFGGTFAPNGWALCNGQLVAISEYDALFSLIGTTYGGDGQSTFALPDLRGRLPMHLGTGPGLSPRVIGEAFGAESVTLTAAQMPAHAHPLAAAGAATLSSPQGARYGNTGANVTYLDTAPTRAFASAAHVAAGGSQPHDNLMPSLCVNFIISLFGIYPQPS
jgi:microcystin-dependent protein